VSKVSALPSAILGQKETQIGKEILA